MNKTKIEWTDYTWNPVTGCLNECPYCYAREISHRFKRSFEPQFHADKLFEPFSAHDPSRIFVCSMGELFGDWVREEWIERVLEIVRDYPQHIFQFLTKNPKRLPEFNPWPENAWVGATAISQDMAAAAVNYLRDVDVPVRYLSCEPLLGPIDIDLLGIDWVIIGACTGRMARQPERAWVETLNRCAQDACAWVFYKRNLVWENRPQEFPEVRQWAETRKHETES